MKKKYIVELTEEERFSLREVVKKLTGMSGKVKRANILLKADRVGRMPRLPKLWIAVRKRWKTCGGLYLDI
jgi:hypothetical protein